MSSGIKQIVKAAIWSMVVFGIANGQNSRIGVQDDVQESSFINRAANAISWFVFDRYQIAFSKDEHPKQPASVLQDFDIEDSKLTNPCYVRIRDATGENQRGMMATTPENTISISDATTKSGKDQIYSFLDQQRVFDGLRSTTWIQQIDYYHEANKTRMVASRPSHHPGWQFDYYRYADNPQSEAIEKESFYYLVPGPVETPRSAVLKSIQYLFHNRQLLDALLEQASIKREASARYRRKYPPRPPHPAWMLAVRGSSRLLHLLQGGY